MELITQKDFAELSHVHDATCVSIFLPTHRSGEAVSQNKDALVLKNLLKDARGQLKAQGTADAEIESLLKPAEDLLDDARFWSHQSDGLALFMAPGFIRKYLLPIGFEAFHHVSNAFYLKPLFPMFNGDGRFFILTLEIEAVHFYEGTRHSITDVRIEDLTPDRLEEVVGYDFEQKNLQFRSQQGMHNEAVFHGQGAGSADRKNEIQRYFRAIDKGLMKMLHDERVPMVVVALDYLFAMYQEVNTYPHLMDQHVSKNPAGMDTTFLHETAWEIVKPEFGKTRKEKVDMCKQLHDTEKASAQIEEILPAAMDGKIDTLFLRNRSDIWGTYDATKRTVRISENGTDPNVSLMNLAAIKTFLQGGNVYLVEEEEMPASYSKVNALFRY